jgi:hypothetical protein
VGFAFAILKSLNQFRFAHGWVEVYTKFLSFYIRLDAKLPGQVAPGEIK